MRSVFSPGAAVAALLCAGVTVQGGTLRYCPGNANGDVCYSAGVPSSSASAAAGNIYLQISAPTTYQWVALGTGTVMAGSNMFIMYQDGNGNVTISPRKGTFHRMPELDTSSTAAKLTLLAGSGVSADGNTMTANFACANCESWDGGTLDLAGTDTSWIAAWRQGSAIASTSQSASLVQHDETAIFELDLTKAAISADSNPYVSGGDSSSGSGGNGGSDTGSGNGGSGGGSSSDGSGVTVISASTLNNSILAAHGIIMAIVFVILYPLGALLMPLLGKWWAHAGFQTVVWCLMWAGFGVGVRCAMDRNLLFKQTHTILGTVVVALLVIQPGLGYAHHRYYLKNQRRGLVSHAHVWYGRALMVLGVVNGGLGLQLALADNSLIIAYSVVSAVIFLVYAIGKVLVSIRRKQAANPRGGGKRNGQKDGSGSPRSPPGGVYA